MKLVITFKPIVLDINEVDEKKEAEEFIRTALPEQLQNYLDENWTELVDPSQPMIEKVEVID